MKSDRPIHEEFDEVMATLPSTLELSQKTVVKSEIVCTLEGSEWCIKINKEGIFFNKDLYPNFTANDFALAFILILEKQFTVTFGRMKE